MATSLEELKNKTYEQLKEAMVNALVKKDLSEEEMGESARYISFHLGAVESPEELMLFLDDLSNRWVIYKDACLALKKEETQQEDQERLQKAQEELKNLTQ